MGKKPIIKKEKPYKVLSQDILSSAGFCDSFLGIYPVFSGDKGELRRWLETHGHSLLRDYPLEEIGEIVKAGLSVVLVDTTYIDEEFEIVHEYRWFEVKMM